ncbi:alpha/beta hydrolase [Nocardia beijingensis]|uniref:alpha/beta fold hydrolase n=1 Tax=Nocardia beijingensis TaxID=95162 RepID=UPI001895095C|nr:alpha/beta hydrolase [Nocardia beijingensis]MBF6468506.1 alpha/beta hydrolase [Nocardia beijingensis]
MSETRHYVDLDGARLFVRAMGTGPAIVFVHGFPQTSNAWSKQIRPIADAGYKVIAPDLRGFGRSSGPGKVDGYDADTVSADLVGLLDWAGEKDAVFVGHDIGAIIVWHLARAHPSRVRGVAALSVPCLPRATRPPTELLSAALGQDHYLLFFQVPDEPEKVLSRDVRRTLLTEGNWTEEWGQSDFVPTRPPWLSEAELKEEIALFTRTGFSPPLGYYRNFDRNWELGARFGEGLVRQPALFITGSEDLVRTISPAQAMKSIVPDLRSHVLAGAGHFIQQERPEQVNGLLLDFFRELDGAVSEACADNPDTGEA